MTYRKSRLKVIILIVVVLAAVAVGWLVFKPSAKTSPQPPTNKPGTSTTKNSDQGQTTTPTEKASSEDFTYQTPENWAALSKELLDSSKANSGIGHKVAPFATFKVSVTDGATSDLKNATLSGLKKLTNFSLLASGDAKLDGQTAQKFTYTFEGQDKSSQKQELYVLVYKQKTFSLLFSSTEADYDKQAVDFAVIFSSFKFK